MNDTHSLSHTKWNCKYHIVFAPKYRRKVFYEEKRLEVGAILRELCNWKGVNIIEAEVCPDHVHMLVQIPPKMSVSSFMGFLKGKSSLMIYERWGNLKYKYRSREFWCRGYYVDTAGKDAKKIKAYIQNQLKEDQLNGQLTIDDIDPFKGSKQQLFACGRSYQRPLGVASRKGLRPLMKYPRLSRGIFIYALGTFQIHIAMVLVAIANVIVVGSFRKGCDEKLPERVVYVSCNPGKGVEVSV